MVICDSSEQAKEMFKNFQARSSLIRGALILHDIGSKEDRKQWADEFKEGNIDILFVYNMLLTGFDAKRLKKLYLGRIVRRHNLLQTLTRVNRPYNNFRYGYVVDFADIQKEFEVTNQAYFEELQSELGDELEYYSHLFKSPEEITQEIEQIKDVLFRFNTENAEVFSQQISQIQTRADVLSIKSALSNARSLYNLIRLQGNYPLLQQLDFQKLNQLYHETSRHLDLLNLKESLESGTDNTNLLNQALEHVAFLFTKIKEEELAIADQLINALQKARETLLNNFDQQDPAFITLKEELERLFKKKKLNEVTLAEMDANITALNSIHEKAKELNRRDDLLKEKYHGDAKYARIHKRLLARENLSIPERQFFTSLYTIKKRADGQVLQNSQLLSHEPYFEKMMMPLIIEEFQKNGHIKLSPDTYRAINRLVVNEYVREYTSGNTPGGRK
jgi:type I restriction enzyme R subunit